MKEGIIPENESERLDALKSYDILDSLPESDYDEITKLASEICEMPISLITLIDENRQWFKSKVGLSTESTARQYAFCAHSLSAPSTPLVVNNATEDDRFHDNPLVTGDPNVIFYAGVPLVDKDGFPLGNLCVIDNHPNKISEKKLDALKILSNQVVKLIELRKANALLKKSKSELKIINQNLQDFAHVVSHDLKAPVRHVLQYSELINDEVNEGKKKHIGKHLQKIEDSATEALELIDGILRYSRSINSYDISTSNIMISKMIEDIFDKCNDSDHIRCIVCLDQNEINISRITLSQILTNIISNAVKYIDKSSGLVKITLSVDEEKYNFEIEDNGIGIQEDKLGIIFNLFYMVEDSDLAHINRNGIGLNIVKKLIQNCGGTISVKSQRGVGSVFSFSIPKNSEN